MPQMTEAAIKEFVGKPRLGYLTTLKRDGAPSTFPMWVEWDGSVLRMLTSRGMLKLKRMQNDPRVNVTVGNENDEAIRWVSFEGSVEIKENEGKELALRLAPRYWGKTLSDPIKKGTVEMWEASDPETFCLIELRPDRVNSFTYDEPKDGSTR